MRTLRVWLVRLGGLVFPARADEDFDAELASHLQLHIDDNVRAGLPADEARRQAVLKLGGVAQTRERHRERRRLPLVDGLRHDLAYAFRTLRRDPAFTATAALTLALGIGAATAIFSIVNAVLLQPLPFPASDRLVMIYGISAGRDRFDSVSYPTFVDWRDQSHTLAGAAAFANRRVTVSVGGSSDLVRAQRVTPAMFAVLGVQPSLGRAFRPDEERDAARVVILSDAFWRRWFAGSRDALGRVVEINDEPHTVVGVMPAAFHIELPEQEQLYLPQPIDPNRRHGFLRIIARLNPGVSAAQATSDLNAVSVRLSQLYGRSNESSAAAVVPLVDALAGPSRDALVMLLAVVALVLLIACSNVASLLLARGAARRRELAVRAALGAGRARLTRQLLTESLVLASLGGVGGLAAAHWLGRALAVVVGSVFAVPRIESTRIDGRVLGFAIATSILTGALFGIVPALWSTTANAVDGLRDGGRTSSGRAPRVRRGLVIVETALAMVLLAGAGVLARTLLAMATTHPGFDARRMLAVEIWLPPVRFPRVQDRAAYFDRALASMRALPQVEAASFVSDLPLSGSSDNQSFHIVGQPDPGPGRMFSSGFNIVSPGYFAAMRIPVREGREFLESDRLTSPGVIVVNEAAVRRFWNGHSPIGEQIRLPVDGGRSVLMSVVGVTADVRHMGLIEPPRSEIFLTVAQSELNWASGVFAARTRVSPLTVADAVKAALARVNSGVPVLRVSTMDTVIARTMAAPQLYSILFGLFAATALVLAAVGLYGLISYSVTQRARELGIRAALGASRPEIVRLVLADGVRLAAVGVALGAALGVGAVQSLVALIRGVKPNDWATFAVMAGVLLAAALLASYLPARRAGRVDPLTALRSE